MNEHTVLGLVRHFKGSGLIIRFIEFMDVGNLNGWERTKVVPSAELVERVNAEMPIEPVGANYPGEVAERWRFVDGDGEIGFISSVTQPFCAGCTRARLSPEHPSRNSHRSIWCCHNRCRPPTCLSNSFESTVSTPIWQATYRWRPTDRWPGHWVKLARS